jgi:hypothetical protein
MLSLSILMSADPLLNHSVGPRDSPSPGGCSDARRHPRTRLQALLRGRARGVALRWSAVPSSPLDNSPGPVSASTRHETPHAPRWPCHVRRVRARHSRRVSRRRREVLVDAESPVHVERTPLRHGASADDRCSGRSVRIDPRPGILVCGSIAGRRASGFLQVSLSKVPRPQHRATFDQPCAEALPMNAGRPHRSNP